MSQSHVNPRFGPEAAAMIRLASPLALAQLAQVAMGTTDTILLGSLGRDALAAGGLGTNLFFTLMLVVSGGLMSVSILVAHARGAGENWRIPFALRGGVVLSLLVAIPPMLLLSQAEPILLLIGEPAALAHAIARYDGILLFAMPASLLLATQRAFLAAVGRPRMVMSVALAAVAVNGLLNYGLIHGAWGLPNMGYIGSCTATLITFWAMTGAIGFAMRLDRGLAAFRVLGPLDWRILGEMAVLGWPISLLLLVEITLFTVAALIIGMFGETPLASHQISMNCAAVTFMVPLAISQAVNVRVGYHAGARMPRAARLSGVVGFLLGVGFMSLASAVLLAAPRTIADLFITAGDPNRSEVVGLSVRLLTIAAAFQIFDGAQVIAVGALRGLKDTRTPAIIAGFGYWAIGFTTAWTLGVRLGYGVTGIWWGLAAGLAAVAILLSLRFWRLSGRMIAGRGLPIPVVDGSLAQASIAE